ncbi:MAG: glycerate kinase [Jatrophihabitantaceae bacterium]
MAGARMQAGADLLLDIIGYDELLRNTDLVVTGEGSLDVQTLAGKAPARIAARAAAVHVPVVAVVGRCLLDYATLTRAGVRRVYPLSDLEPDTAMSIANAAELLRRTGEAIAADWISQD